MEISQVFQTFFKTFLFCCCGLMLLGCTSTPQEALMHAAEQGQTDTVERLLVRDNNISARDLGTALIYASGDCHTDTAELSLSEGADVNTHDEIGHSALLYAAVYGCRETTKALLKHGANVNTISGDGRTALMEAEYMGHAEVAKVLRDNGAFR